jgi:hypothetical protein
MVAVQVGLERQILAVELAVQEPTMAVVAVQAL